MMQQILAYGDSLTWGADPVTGLRHPHEDLWPSVLEGGLGGAARVLHDGLGGRTTCFDDHAGPSCRNAVKTLPVALGSHMPLDLLILFLGTNDLKPIHGGVAIGAQAGMRRLARSCGAIPTNLPMPFPRYWSSHRRPARRRATAVPTAGGGSRSR